MARDEEQQKLWSSALHALAEDHNDCYALYIAHHIRYEIDDLLAEYAGDLSDAKVDRLSGISVRLGLFIAGEEDGLPAGDGMSEELAAEARKEWPTAH